MNKSSSPFVSLAIASKWPCKFPYLWAVCPTLSNITYPEITSFLHVEWVKFCMAIPFGFRYSFREPAKGSTKR
jgi:hypothetical protein